jgi:hypothetical protein
MKQTKNISKKKILKKKISKKKISKTKKYNQHHTNSLHFQDKLYDRKTDILKFQYTPKLRGGKFIDKGGFGCVISPALSCSSSDKNLDKSVSKIIKQQSDTISKELKISDMLKKIDPTHNFYITIDKYCFINEIPNDRTDISNVKYDDDDLSKYKIQSKDLLDKYGRKKKIDKKFCDVDLNLKPLNLIMPYAGISLSSVMKVNRKSYKSSMKNKKLKKKIAAGTDRNNESDDDEFGAGDDTKPNPDTDINNNNNKALMHQMFVNNLKIYFKHLIIGLLKMHNNRIVNKDIKQRNIMLYWNFDKKTDKEPNNLMLIRYIDFGLSDFLTNDFCKNKSNIGLKGTPFYLSPELFICAFLNKYKDRPESYKIKKINEYIEKNVIRALNVINENSIIAKMNSSIEIIYKKIKYLYENERLLEAYFGSETNKYNGYLQKSDVYALGLSIYETLYKYSKINVKGNDKLYDLLLHMIDMNPDKRYNIVQCLSHPYFSEKK